MSTIIDRAHLVVDETRRQCDVAQRTAQEAVALEPRTCKALRRLRGYVFRGDARPSVRCGSVRIARRVDERHLLPLLDLPQVTRPYRCVRRARRGVAEAAARRRAAVSTAARAYSDPTQRTASFVSLPSRIHA